jgi:tryptophan synthase alpha chain
VGFGISTPAQVRKFAALADGVVIGSAFVKWISRHSQEQDFLKQAVAYAREKVFSVYHLLKIVKYPVKSLDA